ncbi:slipin family protein [Polycyclovorans algicola]|uniref:slipin family protein n=1 Tax=Polycyclovorans algicola TaxID=616992 RepID=UPI0004A6C808|nr:slipin family protein [Polycyclovorans algicola]
MLTTLLPVVLVVVFILFSAFKVLNEYERAVVLTLGRYTATKGPGLIIIIPGIQKMLKVDMRTVVMDVPPQDVISRDNVSVNVNAVVYFRVVDAAKAKLQVEHYYEAISQVAQTTMRSVLGRRELDEMLTERSKLSTDIQEILDEATNPWGVKITNVELKHVDLQESMIRAMARQAEAERSRRAKVIHAEGEMQASEKLREAAAMLSQEPQAMQLRYMQTLIDIAGDKNSTIVFPLPMDLITPFLKTLQGARQNDEGATPPNTDQG